MVVDTDGAVHAVMAFASSAIAVAGRPVLGGGLAALTLAVLAIYYQFGVSHE
jgi:hypothetical protein